jgi:hypothetical protein
MERQFDETLKSLHDSLPDRLERGQDGIDLSRLEPGVGLVYTGLGGVGQRLRFLVIVPVQHPPLEATALPALKAHWHQAAHAHNSKVGDVMLATDYVQITLLIPMDVAPDDVVQAGLRWQWKGQQPLYPEYFITNDTPPTEEEIADLLVKLRNQEPGTWEFLP